jgi:hypothetical protein
MAENTELKLQAGIMALVILVVGGLFAFYGNQETELHRRRIEQGFSECQKIGETGTVWVKGPCPGQY